MHPIQIIGGVAAAPTPAALPSVKPEHVTGTETLDAEGDFAAVFLSTADPVQHFSLAMRDGVTTEDDAPTTTPTKDVTDAATPVSRDVKANETQGSDYRSGQVQSRPETAMPKVENPAEAGHHRPSIQGAAAPPEPDRSMPLPSTEIATETKVIASVADRFVPVSLASPVVALGRTVAVESMPDTIPQTAEIHTQPAERRVSDVDPAKALPVSNPVQHPRLSMGETVEAKAAEQVPQGSDPSGPTTGRSIAADIMHGSRAMHKSDFPSQPRSNPGQARKPAIAMAELPPARSPRTPEIDAATQRVERLVDAPTVRTILPMPRPDLEVIHHLSPLSRGGEGRDRLSEPAIWQGTKDMITLHKPSEPLLVRQAAAEAPKLTGVAHRDPLAGDVMPEQETGLRGTAEASKPGMAPMPPPGQQGNPLAQHVARQLAEALQQMPNRPVEITLNPQELGRVRLSLSSSETGIIVHLLAERPETMDLMRRQISELQTAFQEIGYRDIRFSFSDGRQPGSEKDDSGQPTGTRAREEAIGTAGNAPEITLSTAPVTGLDIRL